MAQDGAGGKDHGQGIGEVLALERRGGAVGGLGHGHGRVVLIVEGEQAVSSTVEMLADPVIDSLFYAAIEATEEAIVNALVAAETMTGGDDVVAYALPHDELMSVMRAHEAHA